jgi:golgi to ER traffic protein 4
LANIGEVWFGIRIPKQGTNPLFDMMSNMMFGGGQKQGTPRTGTPKPGGGAKKEEKKETAAPAAMDLD